VTYSTPSTFSKTLKFTDEVVRLSACRIGITLFLLSLLMFAPISLRAQLARLTGDVTDTSGAVIPGAAISIESVDTGIRHDTTTGASGAYDVAELQPGHYSVHIEKDGFAALQQTGITLLVDTTTRLDFSLSVGRTSNTVTVSADASMLQPSTPEDATEITQEQFARLPLVQQGRIRSPTAFVYLAPGVQGNINPSGAENTAATNFIQVNGSPIIATEIYLDGLPYETPGDITSDAPAVDALQEFKLTTTQVPSDYGHTGAAVGVFSVKSGTNAFHGSAYEYLRNSDLDANSWIGNNSAVPFHPPTHQNEFGVTIGGPMRFPKLYDGKDKAFFFFAFGASRKAGFDSVSTLHLPDVQELQGNFGGVATIFDPATTTTSSTGVTTRQPFANNQIPAGRIDPIAKQIAGFYPQITSSAAQNYRAAVGEELLNENTFVGKIDYTFSAKQSVSGTLTTTNIPRKFVSIPLPAPLTGGYYQIWSSPLARINYVWAVTAKQLNVITAGYNLDVNNVKPIIPGSTPFVTVPGLPGYIFPSISFVNYSAIAANSLTFYARGVYQIRDTYSWNVGAHTVRFGGEFRRFLNDSNQPQPASGSMSFSPFQTADPNNPNTTGDDFASFLLGQANSGSLLVPLELASRQDIAGVFIQDDWKVTSKLTINAGMRFELQSPFTEKAQKSSIVSLTTPNPGAGNLPGAVIFAGSGTGRSGKSEFVNNDYTAFGPRVGISYQVLPSTVLRAGYGIYYYDNELALVTNGFQPQATYSASGYNPAFVLSSGYPDNVGLHPPAITPTLLNGASGTYLDPNAAAMPRLQEWVANVQHSFGSNLLFEVAYVGSHGTRLADPSMVNINQLDPKYLSLGTLLSQPATSTAAKNAGIQLPYPGFSGTVAQALRPYSQYQTLTSQGAKVGKQSFNALEAVVQKRMGAGLTLNASYTFSKNMGYSNPSLDGSGVTNNVLQNSYNPQAEWSILPNDVRNALVISYNYELPIGSGKALLNHVAPAVNDVIGGWSFSAIQRYQNGYPLGILMSNSLSSSTFNYVLRPNIVPGADTSTHLPVNKFIYGQSSLINAAAFQAPAAFTFGTARPTYGDLRNFPIYTEDFSGVKKMKIGEHVQWSLYGQAFNVFNRHRFTGVSTTFGSKTFGQPGSASEARLIQVGTRLEF
jgi:hypothetical protein